MIRKRTWVRASLSTTTEKCWTCLYLLEKGKKNGFGTHIIVTIIFIFLFKGHFMWMAPVHSILLKLALGGGMKEIVRIYFLLYI